MTRQGTFYGFIMIDRRYNFLGATAMVTSTSGHRHGSDQKDDNACQ
jgi:hypothetical protein